MVDTTEYDKDYALQQLRRSHQHLRRVIKYFYLNNILYEVLGPTIDFGCGAGQLLARLPAGSIGLEVNPYLVIELQKKGLNALLYKPATDQFSLCLLPQNHYKTLVIAHVLEHFINANLMLRTLLRSCSRLGIQRVILVLPGAKGFRFDKTHKTFIDRQYLENQGLLCCEGYTVNKISYFPFNIECLGNYFTFHELKVIYDWVEKTVYP
jgi:hypothetical protein